MSEFNAAIEHPGALAVTFAGESSDAVIAKVANVANVAELRADLFPYNSEGYLAEQAQRVGSMPVLLTLRSADQGGAWEKSEDDRLALFAGLSEYVDAFDVEAGSDIFADVVALAHDQNKPVIGSYHNFVDRPSLGGLRMTYYYVMKNGADYAKLAANLETPQDFAALLEVTLENERRDNNMISVGMGNYGPLARVTLPFLGSRLTYAFAGEQAVAPGQMGYRQTARLLEALNPHHDS